MSEPVSVFAKHQAEAFTRYNVKLTLRDRMLGGLPGDPHMMRGWLKRSATQASARAAGANKEQIRDETIRRDMISVIENLGYDVSELAEIKDLDELEAKAVELMGEQKVTRFARNDEGVCVEARAVKAMLKENASICFPTAFFSKETGEQLPTQNSRIGKGLKSYLAERVFIEPHLIPVKKEEPDAIHSKVTHGPYGASLGLHEAIDEAEIEFQILVKGDQVEQKTWAEILTSAELNGLGACRSLGFGTFAVTKFEKAK
jgi:hypothetical protein